VNPLLLAGIAAVLLSLLFVGIYLLARRIDNYGIVDVAWSYAFAVTALVYALGGAAPVSRRLILLAMVGAWSLRLGTHLHVRVMGHHPVEDGRYQQLRRDWHGNFAPRMFGFFQLQAGSVVILAVPFLLAMNNPASAFHPLEFAGLALWAIALSGEAVADAQLKRFKRDPSNRDKVCAVGLWRYSRHPNYFFEWVVWVGYAVFAAAAPWGWLGVISPAIILYLLLRVTGIPLTEEQSVRSKGDAYRKYQYSTSAFVPWFPRHTRRADARDAPT
jgi:steroid 5-alpha reductase family enzyme